MRKFKLNKNKETKEKIKKNISKQELRKLKGIIEEKDIKRVSCTTKKVENLIRG